MIISQAPVRDSLWSRGFRRGEDVMVRQRNPVYIDEQLFYDSLSGIFIRYFANLRSHNIFSRDVVICQMDSASSHVSERCVWLSYQNHVLAMAFPAHTTNILQALDLVFFGALKKLKATVQGQFNDDSVHDQITTLVEASEQKATSRTIGASFCKAGMLS
jgi:hypothetical protein